MTFPSGRGAVLARPIHATSRLVPPSGPGKSAPLRLIVGLFFALAPALPAAPVGVLLAATETELQPLLARLADSRTEGDPLNAVAASTLALRRHAPQLVVTFGTARAHDPTVRSGDVVVSDAPYEGVPFNAQAASATTLFTVNFLQNLPTLP